MTKSEKKLTEHEIKYMEKFTGEVDVIGIHREGCYWDESQNNIILEIDQLEGSLFNIKHYYIDASYIAWGGDMMLKIAAALKKVHDKNLGHFDLKDENIFMVNKFTPSLGDLGFMHELDGSKSEWKGTPEFLCSEVKK